MKNLTLTIITTCLIAFLIFIPTDYVVSKENINTSDKIQNTRFYESQINYSNVTPRIAYSGQKTIAVTVFDKRSYVLSGQTGPEYVGIFRGGFGRPYDIGTLSFKPLADELSQSVQRGFINAGFKNSDSVTPDRVIAIEILEWLSVSGSGFLSLTFGTDLHYHLIVKVYDGANNVLITRDVKGTDKLGGKFSEINELIPKGTEEVFNRVFNNDEMKTALTN